MTAYQDLQSTGWRDVAIGELPEVVVYRNDAGTFTRSVTAGFIATIIIQLIVRGKTTLAVPFYGVGVFMPITVMALAVRRHVLSKYTGRARRWGSLAASIAAALGVTVFLGQIIGKWGEGGWVVLISFSVLILGSNLLLISPAGYRDASTIHRIVREKAKVKGAMASIVEWQSLKMQEYRYSLVYHLAFYTAKFFDLFGVRRPLRYEPAPVPAGEYDEAVHIDHPTAPSLLAQHLAQETPHVGGTPNVTAKQE
jgi:hypothetical protein